MNILFEAADDDCQNPFVGIVSHSNALGIRFVERSVGRVVFDLPYREDLVGNASLRAMHGGALGALMEFASVCQLLTVSEIASVPKTVCIAVEYLRSTTQVEIFARASITRCGRRIANVKAIPYQNDANKPAASARAHFLLAAHPDTES